MTSTSSDDAPAQPGVVVVPVPADAAARAALTARVTTLTGVRHPHLVAVLEVRTVRDGALDVVLARGEAADLPAVLAVRGRLAPGEAAAVGVHVAQALAALHAAGLVHGPLEPGDVVLRPGGAPALRPRAAVPPEEWNPAEDVRAAARLVDGLLGSRPVGGAVAGPLDGDPVADPDGALRGALDAALGADARRRPEAGTLAALLNAACEPAMVRLPDPATLAGAALAGVLRAAAPPSGAPRRFRGMRTPGRRAGVATGAPAVRRSPQKGSQQRALRRGARGRRTLPRPASLRPVLVIAGVGLAVGAMTGAALQWLDPVPGAPEASESRVAVSLGTPDHASAGGSESAQPSATADPGVPVSGPTVSAQDAILDKDRPEDAAAALTQRRLDLLATPDADPDTVDLAGSPAHDADMALLAQLEASGVRPQHPRATVTSTAETRRISSSPWGVRVRVEYVVEAHDQVAADGTRTAVPASGAQTATLDLQWTDDGWRVTAVA